MGCILSSLVLLCVLAASTLPKASTILASKRPTAYLSLPLQGARLKFCSYLNICWRGNFENSSNAIFAQDHYAMVTRNGYRSISIVETQVKTWSRISVPADFKIHFVELVLIDGYFGCTTGSRNEASIVLKRHWPTLRISRRVQKLRNCPNLPYYLPIQVNL